MLLNVIGGVAKLSRYRTLAKHAIAWVNYSDTTGKDQ